MSHSTITIGQHSSHPLMVNRMGYGTMRLTGNPHIWGEPADRPQAVHDNLAARNLRLTPEDMAYLG